MRSWAVLAASAALALLMARCGGGGSGAGEDGVRLPHRIDAIDGALRDAPAPPPPLDANVDAPPPACDVTKPFGTPLRIAELDAATHRATPHLSADELTIYYTTSGLNTGADLSMVVRTSKAAPFGGEKVLAQSGPSNDNDPSVSADHLSLWFASNRGGTSDIFLATRPAASTGVPFGVATAIAAVNRPDSSEAHAYIRAASTELWFVSDRLGGPGGYDIFRSTGSGAVFAAPTRVAELNSAANDFQPQPSEDGLTVLFASDRPGGLGATDLWMAKRPSVSVPFGAPAPITELNSANTESAGWLSADRCRIWFGSGRNTADAGQQLFFAERPR